MGGAFSGTVDRYVARLMAPPFAATLAIFAMLLLLVRMAEFLTVVMEGGGTALTMLRLLGYLTPQYLAMAIPVGLVAAVVLAFRRLALSGEWDALSSAGISPMRLLRVPMLYAAAAAAAVFAIAAVVQPLSVYAGQKLLFELSQGAEGISVPAGQFVRLGPDLVVRAQDSRGRELRGLLISRRDGDGRLTVIAAARAQLAGDRLHLWRGTMIRVGRASRAVAFGAMSLPVPRPAPPAFRVRGMHERERTWAELLAAARASDTAAVVSGNDARAGLARRVAQSAVLLALPLFAFGFARPPLRSSDSSGLFIALAGFIVFNEISLFAERLGFNGQVPPVFAQAVVLLAFAALAAGVFHATARRPTEAGTPPWAALLRALSAPRTAPIGLASPPRTDP